MNSESDKIIARIYNEDKTLREEITEKMVYDFFMDINPMDSTHDDNKTYLNTALLGELVKNYCGFKYRDTDIVPTYKIELSKDEEKLYAQRALKHTLDHVVDIYHVLGGEYVLNALEDRIYGYYYAQKSKIEKLYEKIDNFINSASKDDMDKFVEATRRTHRTLQQKLFKLIMMLVVDYSKRDCDGRNEIACYKAAEIVSKVEDITCMPLI